MATPTISSMIMNTSFFPGWYWYLQCANKSTHATATVPKIAPLAPTDGAPTNAKLPPSTLLREFNQTRYEGNRSKAYPKIPAAKYRIRKAGVPISLST